MVYPRPSGTSYSNQLTPLADIFGASALFRHIKYIAIYILSGGDVKAVQLLHFESATDSDGNVWEDQLVGTSSAKVSFEGWIDTNSSTATDSGSPGLSNGLVVTMSLILVKGTPWGFNEVSVQIDQVEVGSAIDSDKPATFKGTGVVKGSPGKTTTITG